ncbi:MAG: hypothetical protein ACOX7K_05435 [Oscillospiraceae bacterium]|jgi:hypothetical protein
MFNIREFREVATAAYREAETTYTLGEALSVFTYFFAAYEAARGEPHPPIRKQQIIRIMEAMPYIEQADRGNGIVDIEAEYYPALIDAYFKTDFPNCNYRINHFFSGRIRELRYYEELF